MWIWLQMVNPTLTHGTSRKALLRLSDCVRRNMDLVTLVDFCSGLAQTVKESASCNLPSSTRAIDLLWGWMDGQVSVCLTCFDWDPQEYRTCSCLGLTFLFTDYFLTHLKLYANYSLHRDSQILPWNLSWVVSVSAGVSAKKPKALMPSCGSIAGKCNGSEGFINSEMQRHFCFAICKWNVWPTFGSVSLNPHCHLLKNNFKHIHWAEVKGRPASPHVSACAAFSKQPWFSQQRAGSALCKSSSCWGVRGWSEVLEGQTGNIESFQQQGFEKSETLWASLKPAMSCFCRWMREPDVISPSREHVIPAGSSQRMSSSNVSESIHFKEKVPDVISIKMNIKALSTSQKRTILKPALSCL